jgi:5,10-methylene-tetrahydrofolate dehydrogenase/methenyl tetrahydrofolate cyclohydrolase
MNSEKRIDGSAVAKLERQRIAQEVAEFKSLKGINPGLAVVLVGDRKDSHTYVGMKKKACAEVGIESFSYTFVASISEKELEECIVGLNGDVRVHGILVQLPLPSHIDAGRILQLIDPRKDVDGIHPVNMGRLALGGNRSTVEGLPKDWRTAGIEAPLEACTPKGCMRLLRSIGLESLSGKRAVVIGRSNIVGRPMALMLLRDNATVTVCHSRTPVDVLREVVGSSDIVVAACGRALLVQGSWLKEGCVVLDVGTNAVDDATSARGYRLVGDVDLSSSQDVSRYSPVPGGVGPMTIAMLLENTLLAAWNAVSLLPH